MPKQNEVPPHSIDIRKKIISYLKGKKLTANDILEQTDLGITYSALSYHLCVLKDQGFIRQISKQGRGFVYVLLNASYEPNFTELIKKPSNVTYVSMNDYHTKGSTPKRSSWIKSCVGDS